MRILTTMITVLAVMAANGWTQSVHQVPTSYPTIQSAIDAAQSGDFVEILPGTYLEHLTIADKDIELRAQTRGTVVIDAGGIATCVLVERSMGCVLDGLVITNGLGASKPFLSSAHTYGGGIWLRGTDLPNSQTLPTHLVVRHCLVTGNSAGWGAGIHGDSMSTFLIQDTEVSSNIGTYTAGLDFQSGPIVVERCRIASNGPGNGGLIAMSGFLEMTDTTVEGSPWSGVGAILCRLTRCRLINNGYAMSGLASLQNELRYELYDCLIAGNGSSTTPFPQLRFGGHAFVSGCTIVDNINPPGMAMLEARDFAQVAIDNCIIRDNGGTDFSVVPYVNPFITTPPAQIVVSNSCLSQMNLSGPGNIAVDPLFVDRLSGDYRLMPGSPCVDSGDQTLPHTSSTDLGGRTRVLLNDVDMGAWEARQLGHHPAAAGRVALNGGGPYDLLAVNGSTGGSERRVVVGVGTASSVTMATPPTGVVSANFVIFGVLAEADVESVVHLPFGIGEMMFAPQPMVPAYLHWLFFTFTDNFNPGAPQFSPSTATPWSSGPGPVIPFPLTLTLQGVIEEGPGVFVPTNAIIFEVQ